MGYYFPCLLVHGDIINHQKTILRQAKVNGLHDMLTANKHFIGHI